jgi:predicted dehydrogenase
MLQVGLLGCGRLGREVMLPLLAARPGVRVAVVADAEPSARDAARALAPGADLEPDWRAALHRPGLDAVVVTLPTALHAEAALAALARGVALYLEKPLAATLAEAARVREAARGSATTIALGFNLRFHPLVAALQRALPRAGEPRLARCAFSVAASPGDSWRHPAAAGGGVLLDLASHHVDLLHLLLGRALRRVSAMRRTHAGGGEVVVVAGECEGGVLLDATWASGTVDEDVIEIAGTDGAVRLSRYEDLRVRVRGRGVPGRLRGLRDAVPSPGALRLGLAKRRAPWYDPSFAASLAAFLDAVRERRPAMPGIDEGWQSQRVVAAIAEAAESGRAVDIAPLPDAVHDAASR